MPQETSVSLGEHEARFIEQQLDTGRYGSVSDVVGAGIQLLEERETRRDALRAALIEGENSGSAEPFDADAFLRAKRDGWG